MMASARTILSHPGAWSKLCKSRRELCRQMLRLNCARSLSAEVEGQPSAPAVLHSGDGFIVLNKPVAMRLLRNPKRGLEPSLEDWLHVNAAQACVHLCQAGGQLETATSGAVFIATSHRVAAEVKVLWEAQRVAEVYRVLVRGRLPLHDLMRCHARICRPSEGSSAWRLAGTHREGREACTLLRAVQHGSYEDEPCTLVEARPLTGCRQQIRLHCVALGHPIVGDEMHAVDRRLDWRYEQVLGAPRLMLHCWQLRLPLAGAGEVRVVAPDPLGSFMQRPEDVQAKRLQVAEHSMSPPAVDSVDGFQAEAVGSCTPLIEDELVAGLTAKHRRADAWEVYDGGLPEAMVDETHWDEARDRRRFYGPPFGPPEFDDRREELYDCD